MAGRPGEVNTRSISPSPVAIRALRPQRGSTRCGICSADPHWQSWYEVPFLCFHVYPTPSNIHFLKVYHGLGTLLSSRFKRSRKKQPLLPRNIGLNRDKSCPRPGAPGEQEGGGSQTRYGVHVVPTKSQAQQAALEKLSFEGQQGSPRRPRCEGHHQQKEEQ